MISGYLYGKKKITDWGNFFLNRWKKLYVPYFLFVLFLVGFAAVLQVQKPSIEETIKLFYLCHGFINTKVIGAGHLWFIGVIFVCYWLTPVLQKLTIGEKGSKISDVVLLLIGTMTFTFMVADSNHQQLMWYYSCFFNYAVGYLIGRSSRRIRLIYLVMCAIFMAFVLVQMQWSDVANSTHWNKTLHSFGAQLIFLIFIFGSKFIQFSKVVQPLAVIEKYSMFIYFVHYPFALKPWPIIGTTSSIYLDIVVLCIALAAATAALALMNRYVTKVVDYVLVTR